MPAHTPVYHRVSSVALFAALLAVKIACASEAIGPTRPIAEPNMLEEIHSALKEKEKSGELERFQKEFEARSRRSIEEPNPVASVRTTTHPRSYHIDPTWTAASTILTPDGKTVVEAGQTVNPLDYITWSRKFLFFDGRDPLQVAKAAQIITAEGGAVRAIMVAGKPLDLTRQWKRQIYFDQGGTLTRKFGIQQVPALVYQDGKVLRVDEIKP